MVMSGRSVNLTRLFLYKLSTIPCLLYTVYRWRGWERGRAMVLENVHCRGVQLIWTIVDQGPTVHAVGADGGCLDFFSGLSYLFFSLSLRNGWILTEILSQRNVKHKPTNRLLCILRNESNRRLRRRNYFNPFNQ